MVLFPEPLGPGTVTDVIGIVVVGAIVVMQILRAKKTLKAA